MNNVIKASFWYVVCNVFLKGISFITLPIFSRMLSVQEYGEFGLYNSYQSIITIFLTLSMSASIIRGRFDFKNEMNHFVSSIVAFNIFVPCIIFIMYLVFERLFSRLLSLDSWMIACILIQAITAHAIDTYKTYERFNGAYKRQVYISVFIAVSSTLLSLLLVILLDNKLFGRVIGLTFVYLITGLVICIKVLKNGKPNIRYIKYALRVCIPYIPHTLGTTILIAFDRIVIKQFCGELDVALYSLAYTCSFGISVVNTSLNEAITPWIGDNLYTKNFKEVKLKINVYLVILFFIYLLFVLLVPEILYFMGGKNYFQAKWVLPWIVASIFVQTVTSLYVNIEQFENKTLYVAIGTIVAAILNIILNYLFIPKFGYIGAAIATLISYIILFLLHAYCVKKIGYGFLYSNKRLYFSVFMYIIVVFPILFLYNYFFIRYFILTCILIVILALIKKNKKELMLFIKHKT